MILMFDLYLGGGLGGGGRYEQTGARGGSGSLLTLLPLGVTSNDAFLHGAAGPAGASGDATDATFCPDTGFIGSVSTSS